MVDVRSKNRLGFASSLIKARDIRRELQRLIDHPQANELSLKPFFESYPSAIPTWPWRQNHGVHFSFMFPQYPLGTRFKSDFLYLTKSSVEWWCVLVEFEDPQSKLFQDGAKSVKMHSDFTAALDQIRDWQDFLEKNRDEFLRGLDPIRLPLKMRVKNPLHFKYTLVVGRRKELEDDAEKLQRFSALNKEKGDLRIITYDTLLSGLEQEQQRLDHHDLNLLTRSGSRFRFKHFVPETAHFLDRITPAEIELNAEQIQSAQQVGILAKEWSEGKELTNLGREVRKPLPDALSD